MLEMDGYPLYDILFITGVTQLLDGSLESPKVVHISYVVIGRMYEILPTAFGLSTYLE